MISIGFTTILLLLWWIQDFICHWQPKRSVPTQFHSPHSAQNRLLTHSLHADFKNHLWMFCWFIVIVVDILCNSAILPCLRLGCINYVSILVNIPFWPLRLPNWHKRFWPSISLGASHLFVSHVGCFNFKFD